MTTDIAKKRTRKKRTHPLFKLINFYTWEVDEYGLDKRNGQCISLPVPLRWSPDGGVLFQTQSGNFIVSISSAKIKRWPRKKKV